MYNNGNSALQTAHIQTCLQKCRSQLLGLDPLFQHSLDHIGVELRRRPHHGDMGQQWHWVDRTRER